MSLQCCSLGSGSRGNATVISSDQTTILVDNGFSVKETMLRCQLKGIDTSHIEAILVTHEHSDHASGVCRLAKKLGIPVWLTRGTSLNKHFEKLDSNCWIESEVPLLVGDINVLPFTVPHDARESVQFVFSKSNGNDSIGLLTDTGHITPHIQEVLAATKILLLEFNHCERLLSAGSYPVALKSRISGDYGHLSNTQAIEFLARTDLNNLSALVAMHLSEQNNCPQIVSNLLNGQEKLKKVAVHVADQNDGFEWIKT